MKKSIFLDQLMDTHPINIQRCNAGVSLDAHHAGIAAFLVLPSLPISRHIYLPAWLASNKLAFEALFYFRLLHLEISHLWAYTYVPDKKGQQFSSSFKLKVII